MLPDFPAVKDQLYPLLMNYFAIQVRRHMGFFGEIPTVPVPEGSYTRLIRADGTADDTPFEKMQSGITVETDPKKGLSLEDVLKSLNQLAEDVARKEVRFMHQRIAEVTAATGNVIDARNEGFTPKLLNDSIELMDISFTDDGEACLPALVAHPDVAKGLKAQEEDPEQKRRLEQIILRKREEFLARESRRKLVS